MYNIKSIKVMMFFVVLVFLSLFTLNPHLHRLVRSDSKDTGHCHNHVQLCWIKFMMSTYFGVELPENLYDFTPLYKFSTHMFLDQPEYYTDPSYTLRTVANDGKRIIEFLKLEAMLNGATYPSLYVKKGTDAYGRNCHYNPHSEHNYTFQNMRVAEKVYLYMTDTKNSTSMQETFDIDDIDGFIETTTTKATCKLVDYFYNKTYVIVCPILESDFTISISGVFFTITSGDLVCKISKPWDLGKISSKSLPLPLTVEKMGFGSQRFRNYTCKTSSGHATGFWLKIGLTFHWSTSNCYYPLSFSESVLECLQKKKIIMVGDSHTRDRYNGLRTAYNLTNLKLKKIRHSFFLMNNLLQLYKEYKQGNQPADVLVLNAGQHDLRFNDIVSYISSMKEVLKLLKQMLSYQDSPKIIWIEIMPTHNNGFHGGMRTNQVTEAVNDWVSYEMEALGIPVIYAFNVVKPMTSQHVGDAVHYHSYLGETVSKAKKVSVGGAVCSILVKEICPN